MDMNNRGGMWEGGGWAGWSGVGGKWDNCNSIINKYIKKKKKKTVNLSDSVKIWQMEFFLRQTPTNGFAPYSG